ncbi:MAG TPA: hypothetical protein VMG12_34595 [Polyangiaceae bacterium]|nr:hypothetical protein [Polyangiaceae bacterium]
MSLPASLLAAVANHRCFAARYKSEPATSICLDPSQPPTPVLQASCSDCTLFRVGALATTLPSGITSQRLADDLSQHVCTVRGYLWSTSGYSPTGGFWLSAAYYGNGLFLVDGSRNNNQSSDVDVLISAFRHGMVIPEHPRMLMPSLYTSEVVYLDMSQPITPVQSKADLLASPRCRATRTPGFHRASILEFIPLTRTAALARSSGASTAPSIRPSTRPSAASHSSSAHSSSASHSNSATHSSSAMRTSNIAHANPTTPGPTAAKPATSPAAPSVFETDNCPFCGHEIKERPLFVGTFVGCLC